MKNTKNYLLPELCFSVKGKFLRFPSAPSKDASHGSPARLFSKDFQGIQELL